MAANVIDSFFIALGFKVDPSGAQQMKKHTDSAKDQLLSLGRAVKAFAAGYVVKSVADISNTFEQNTIAISGFLEALDLSTAGQGMADAAATMESIEAAAAKLPGEAGEYIEVFRAGLPVLKGAMPGGGIGAMTDFTNRFTAIGKTLQVDSAQIGRDLSLMLGPKGRAGGNVLTFQRMLPFIRQLKGHANETAESFNVLTQSKRLELLQEALANPALSSMLERSAGSFDAMLGAATSMVKTLVRLSTEGLFKGAKEGLDSIRGIFVDDGGKLTSTGESFVNIMQKLGHAFTRMIRLGAIAVKTFLRFADSSIEVKVGLVAIAGAIIGVQKLLRFGLLGAILLIIEDLHTFYEGGKSITGLLTKEWPQAISVIKGVLHLLGGAFVLLQAKSIGAAVASAAAWAVANAPLLLMLAGIGAVIFALGKLIAKWDEAKADMRNFMIAMQAIGRGDFGTVGVMGLRRAGMTKEADAIANSGIAGMTAKAMNMGAGAVDRVNADKSMAKSGAYGPFLTADAYAGSKFRYAQVEGPVQAPSVNTTTIHVNGARDPKAVADEVVKIQNRQNRNTVRSNQKAHGL